VSRYECRPSFVAFRVVIDVLRVDEQREFIEPMLAHDSLVVPPN
jgi:hypothetical protein